MSWSFDGADAIYDEKKRYPLDDCPVPGIIALLAEHGPVQAWVRIRKEQLYNHRAHILRNLQSSDWGLYAKAARERDTNWKAIQRFEWTYLTEEAFRTKLRDGGIPAEYILDVIKARYDEASSLYRLISECVSEIEQIGLDDYGMSYCLEDFYIDEDDEDSIPYHSFEFSFIYEMGADDLPRFNTSFRVRQSEHCADSLQVELEAGEDSWYEMDFIWTYLFFEATYKLKDLIRKNKV